MSVTSQGFQDSDTDSDADSDVTAYLSHHSTETSPTDPSSQQRHEEEDGKTNVFAFRASPSEAAELDKTFGPERPGLADRGEPDPVPGMCHRFTAELVKASRASAPVPPGHTLAGSMGAPPHLLQASPLNERGVEECITDASCLIVWQARQNFIDALAIEINDAETNGERRRVPYAETHLRGEGLRLVRDYTQGTYQSSKQTATSRCSRFGSLEALSASTPSDFEDAYRLVTHIQDLLDRCKSEVHRRLAGKARPEYGRWSAGLDAAFAPMCPRPDEQPEERERNEEGEGGRSDPAGESVRGGGTAGIGGDEESVRGSGDDGPSGDRTSTRGEAGPRILSSPIATQGRLPANATPPIRPPPQTSNGGVPSPAVRMPMTTPAISRDARAAVPQPHPLGREAAGTDEPSHRSDTTRPSKSHKGSHTSKAVSRKGSEKNHAGDEGGGTSSAHEHRKELVKWFAGKTKQGDGRRSRSDKTRRSHSDDKTAKSGSSPSRKDNGSNVDPLSDVRHSFHNWLKSPEQPWGGKKKGKKSGGPDKGKRKAN